MKKTLWLSIFEPETEAYFKWSVELDLDKPFKFVTLSNNRIGFTQVIKKWWQFWK